MIGTMLFSAVNTLAGQPQSFWQHPETAIRGDGLSIYNSTNHTFDFFLAHGWLAYATACLIYMAAAFLLVSILPRMVALVAIFSFIFGHYYGGSNWLAVRWHYGTGGPAMYGIALAAILTLTAFPARETAIRAVKRLRWVMAGATLLDFINTLIGQPGSYWLHPETVHEANAASRFFLAHGWTAFAAYDLFYIGGLVLLASILPTTIALICIFAFTLGAFAGGSNWFFYEWRLGMQAPVIYGVVLSGVIVMLAFSRAGEASDARG